MIDLFGFPLRVPSDAEVRVVVDGPGERHVRFEVDDVQAHLSSIVERGVDAGFRIVSQEGPYPFGGSADLIRGPVSVQVTGVGEEFGPFVFVLAIHKNELPRALVIPDGIQIGPIRIPLPLALTAGSGSNRDDPWSSQWHTEALSPPALLELVLDSLRALGAEQDAGEPGLINSLWLDGLCIRVEALRDSSGTRLDISVTAFEQRIQ